MEKTREEGTPEHMVSAATLWLVAAVKDLPGDSQQTQTFLPDTGYLKAFFFCPCLLLIAPDTLRTMLAPVP